MWFMDKDYPTQNVVNVPSRKVDDIVEELGLDVVIEVIKIDTQGFEPNVLSGLKKTLSQNRINYILIEFWPRGMNMLAEQDDTCVGVKVLQELANHNFTLYTIDVEAHPKAPKDWKKFNDRPLNSFEEYCQWYLDLEKKVPQDDYKMGYWSNIFAVGENRPIWTLDKRGGGSAWKTAKLNG